MTKRGGIIQLQVDGEVMDAKGNFTYNLGRPKRDPVIGSDVVHGYKDMPQVAFIEGEITDRQDLDLATLITITNATITLRLGNEKTIALRGAWFAGEGTGNTEEGNIPVRFEGTGAEEITP